MLDASCGDKSTETFHQHNKDKDQVDTNTAISIWNTAVKMTSPSAGELLRIDNQIAPTAIFPGVEDMVSLGHNLIVKLALGSTLSPAAQVQSLQLVLVSDYFSNRALVKTLPLQNLALKNIPLTGSAVDVLKLIKMGGFDSFELVTEPDKWAIYVSQSLCFEFVPVKAAGQSHPENSKIAAVEFSFGPMTQLTSPPVIGFTAC